MKTTYGVVSEFRFGNSVHFIIPATNIAVVGELNDDRENAIVSLKTDGTVSGTVNGRWFFLSHRLVNIAEATEVKKWILPDRWVVGWFNEALKDMYGSGNCCFKYVADGYALYKDESGKIYVNRVKMDREYDLVVINKGAYYVTAAHKGVDTLFKRRFLAISSERV